MKAVICGVAGVIAGLLLSVRIEFKTGRCMAYHYDRAFHPEYFK